ncbi:MAG: diaminopimelate decarboxylase [Alphaproteobacteria bacterium]|nr:diaminopimelate decarboxylase [Alphaproteobacteria bacterium]
MEGFTVHNNVLHADELPLPGLADLAGTPVYIYSARKIRANIAALRNAFASVLPADRQPLIAYACKANSHQAVLSVCRAEGMGADVVSGGELRRALAAGITPDKIVYSGVGKNDDEIKLALQHGIRQINVESEPELERIAALATAPVTIALRLNPNVDAGTHAKITTGREDNKFGMPAARIEALFLKYQNHPHIRLQGISLHIGSQLTSLDPYRAAFTKLAEFVTHLRTLGCTVATLDLGGGLGIVYENESAPCLVTYAQIIRDTVLALGTALIVEPGRMIVGDAGILLTRVMYIKDTDARRYMILDAGMNDLVRPAMYDAFHGIHPVIHDPAAELLPYDIVGPVCETGDTFARGRIVPRLQSGALVAIMTAGAYGASMSSTYNTRPAPAEIMVDGTHAAVIRPRADIQAIIDSDHVPEWLAEAVA